MAATNGTNDRLLILRTRIACHVPRSMPGMMGVGESGL